GQEDETVLENAAEEDDEERADQAELERGHTTPVTPEARAEARQSGNDAFARHRHCLIAATPQRRTVINPCDEPVKIDICISMPWRRLVHHHRWGASGISRCVPMWIADCRPGNFRHSTGTGCVLLDQQITKKNCARDPGTDAFYARNINNQLTY